MLSEMDVFQWLGQRYTTTMLRTAIDDLLLEPCNLSLDLHTPLRCIEDILENIIHRLTPPAWREKRCVVRQKSGSSHLHPKNRN